MLLDLHFTADLSCQKCRVSELDGHLSSAQHQNKLLQAQLEMLKRKADSQEEELEQMVLSYEEIDARLISCDEQLHQSQKEVANLELKVLRMKYGWKVQARGGDIVQVFMVDHVRFSFTLHAL